MSCEGSCVGRERACMHRCPRRRTPVREANEYVMPPSLSPHFPSTPTIPRSPSPFVLPVTNIEALIVEHKKPASFLKTELLWVTADKHCR